MQAEIITIGDEILIGQVIDSNSAFIATLLNLNGIRVKQITSISDDKEHIINALNEAKKRANIILITGGLGPTKDDITKHTLAHYFNSKMRFDKVAYEDVKRIFDYYKKEISPINKLQAQVPENCTVIRNLNGTAPGMWFDEEDRIYVSMPGVPYEMKAMMKESVIPMLQKRFQLPFIVHKTVITQGIGESFLSDIITDWENSLVDVEIKLAYLPSPGMRVRLRLSIFGENKEHLNSVVDKKIEELLPLIPDYFNGYEVFGEELKMIESIIGKILKENNKTLSTAESCTGGYISHLITKVPGSSNYYKGSVISYSNDIKEMELNVPKELLQKKGAVCKEVVEYMAKNIRLKYKTDYSIAASGIAGPAGGTPNKPVGTVWIAIATPNGIISNKFLFGNNRERNIQLTANAALMMLKKELEKTVK